MATKSSRSKHSQFFIGSCTSVLRNQFILAFQNDKKFDLESWLPFTGKIRLPTEMEALKLVLFLRDEAGRKNSWVRSVDIYSTVAKVVKKYWDRAGFITKTRIERDVEKLHDEYRKLLKNRSKTIPKFVKAREMFLMREDERGVKREKLFEIGHPDLEKILEQDRILGNLGVRAEDISFLHDQRGERKMFMAEEDVEYRKKKESQLRRKLFSAPETDPSSSQSTEAADLSDSGDSSEEDNKDDDGTKDVERKTRPKKTGIIDVQLPRNIMSSPLVTAALDRTNTPDNKAMHIISAVLKSAQKDGESLDLNEVSLSRSTIRRGRQEKCGEIARQQYEDFQENMPEYLTLHCDGKLMKDLSDSFKEMEAILVSGSPGYEEGKLLGKK